MQGEEGVVVRGRVEIDTRQPFRSVREAVMLFGEKVLAGEVYGNKLKEMQSKANNVQKQTPKIVEVKAELEETKQTLEKAKEEGDAMAYCLNSLRQELEHTKRELHKLKSRETLPPHYDHLDNPEIEDLKFVETTTKLVQMIDVKTPEEFQKKRSVKFASPILTKMIVSDEEEGKAAAKKTKTKKKPLVPLIGGLFMKKKKKGGKESESFD